MVNIALTGACGKMGRVIADIVSARDDCRISAGIDLVTEQYSDFPVVKSVYDLTEKPDVIIDFSHPSALFEYSILDYCKINNVPIVVATTGYTDEQISQIKSAAEQIPVFFTFNMSLGINLLVDLAKRATKVLGDQFDIEIVEKHHNLKKDAPSGTAIMIAEAINEELDNKMKYVYDRHSVRKPREKNEIGMHAIRGGTIVGDHDIIFAGRDEVITLSHSAGSKQVFAVGSVNAAVYLSKCEKGLYQMSDLLSDVQ